MIDTFIKCRIEPFEYGDHGDSSTQDWVYAVKIIYKDTVQERRFVMLLELGTKFHPKVRM